MTCPKCGSSDVRKSSSPRWCDVFQRVLGREAFRCRGCRKRFYASASVSILKQVVPRTSKRSRRFLRASAKKRLARVAVTLLIFAVAFCLFWVVLRYFMAFKNPTEDFGALRILQVLIPT